MQVIVGVVVPSLPDGVHAVLAWMCDYGVPVLVVLASSVWGGVFDCGSYKRAAV